MLVWDRGYQQVVKEAELLASSPDAIAEELRLAADRTKDAPFDSEIDDVMEQALLALNSPRVDIALAQYCYHLKTARSLFFRTPPSPALRLAVLSNRTLGRQSLGMDPLHLFDRNEEALRAFLSEASHQELAALFRNPTLDDFFLSDLLGGNAGWLSLGEERQRFVVMALSNNPRIKEAYDNRFMDGWAEYRHQSVFDAAWKLAETAPVTEAWARALRVLYERLLPNSYSIENPLGVADRWRSPAAEGAEVDNGFLTNLAGVREGLARLAICQQRAKSASLLEHEDVAFRSAAYAVGDLTPEQMTKAYERDGELAFNSMVFNERLWRIEASRAALRELAWAVVNNDDKADLMAANIFNSREESYRSKYPAWFKDEENASEPEPSEMPATKADLEAVAANLSQVVAVYSQLRELLTTVNSRVGFVWWFSLGALIGAWWGAS